MRLEIIMNPAMITVRLENVLAVLLNKGDIKMNINKFVSWTSNDDETVIINTLTQKCLLLDETGKIIWELILNGNNEEETSLLCIKRFENSDKSIIRNDIHDFFQLLYDNNIIEDQGKVIAQ